MARKRISCKFCPDVPKTNEASKMYIDLLTLTHNRQIANLIYSSYLQPGVAEHMDQNGCVRNSQGQHLAIDVYKQFKGDEMKAEVLKSHKQVSQSFGFSDAKGNLINFEDSEEAYQKALSFNNHSQTKTAYVVANGDKFNILLEDRDSRGLQRASSVEAAMTSFDTLRQELTKRGIEIDVLKFVAPELVNPGAISDFTRYISVLQYTPNDGLSLKDIKLLLALNNQSTLVKNALQRWKTIDEAAQKIYEIIYDKNAPSGSKSFVYNLLTQAKKFENLDRENLIKTLSETQKTVEPSFTPLATTLKELDAKYQIDAQVIVKKDREVTSLLEAVEDAIVSLQRQIRILEKKQGVTPASEELRELQKRLFAELKGKQYSAGLLSYLQTALSYVEKINERLNKTSEGESNLEGAIKRADAISQATNLYSAYYEVISSLALLDGLLIDASISEAEKEELKKKAQEVKEVFDMQSKKLVELQRETMLAVGTEFLGNDNYLHNKATVDIVSMMEADSSIGDWLYSIGRNSNAVISMMGALIRDAQSERDRKLSQIALRIRRANNLLRKEGRDSSYIYEIHYDKDGNIENQYIKSNYDWTTYYKRRAAYAGKLVEKGFARNSIEFTAEMQLWEDQHTEEIEVDFTNHRTERVPIYKLKEPFDKDWSATQKQYYKEMMQIKGELGSLLPSYAQHQFIAPQKRTSWDQIIKEGIRGERSFADVRSRLVERLKFWKLREDDTNFVRNGIVSDTGDTIMASPSAYDDTILKDIPLFYVNKLKDQGDLSHDFSSAMQAFAGTALNYSCLTRIKNLCEVMTDYVDNHPPVEKDKDGFDQVDSINSKGVTTAKLIRKKGRESNTSKMLESFVNQHFYGLSQKNQGVGAVICSNLIGYTSFKGLAINVKGALTNKFVGILQNILIASGGQYYNFKDLAKAEAILMGNKGATSTGLLLGGALGGVAGGIVGAGVGALIGSGGMFGENGKIMDILTDNVNSKDSLIAEFFDISQENFSTLTNKRYHSHMFTRLFGNFNPMFMYSSGEYWIHMMNTYAILLHEKVVMSDPTTGKREIISLYEALERKEKSQGNSELGVRDNIFALDGSKIDEAYLEAIKRRIRYVNQNCHGSMNKEDKGLVHQTMLGRLTLNFRQWMVEHYSRRYRGLHWDESIRDVDLSNFYTHTQVLLDGKKVKLYDAIELVDSGKGDDSFTLRIKDGATNLQGETLDDTLLNSMLEDYAEDSGWRRGYWTDVAVLIKNFFKDYKEYKASGISYYSTLSESQKASFRQVLAEITMTLLLAGLSLALGAPDDHEDEWCYRMWMYVVKRCLFDEIAALPLGAIMEAKTLVNNPIASTQTVSGLLYPIVAFPSLLVRGELNKKVKSGPYKGWNKYVANTVKLTVPFYHQINQMINFGHDESLFNVFDNQYSR